MSDKNKGLKQYSYLSRYTSVPVMGDSTAGRQYHGTVKWIDMEDIEYTIYSCKGGETLENLALNFYGNPQYWWVIADANRIIDSFKPLEEGMSLKIISLNDIKFVKRW